MAPIFAEDADSRDVYLAGPETWTHLFTKETFEVSAEGLMLKNFDAPLGQPAVFVRGTD